MPDTTDAKIAAIRSYCEEVGGALASLVEQAAAKGMPAELSIAAIVGSVPALCVVRGLKRENVIAAINSAWDDVDDA